ncbi:MAG: ATP-dependent endonuclease [Pirellulaceae bacterium]
MVVVVEGPNDVEFLRRISRIVHAHDPRAPDLNVKEQQGKVIFLPLGGGGVAAWADRLAPLKLCEFHLFDRETPPETDARQAIVKRVNRRDGCRASLTRKRSMENYLHPEALARAGELEVTFGDFDPVPDFVARAAYERDQPAIAWDCLPRRAHKRFINRVKRWLNTKVVDQMTWQLLGERDADGEIMSWLDTIAYLAGGAR